MTFPHHCTIALKKTTDTKQIEKNTSKTVALRHFTDRLVTKIFAKLTNVFHIELLQEKPPFTQHKIIKFI